MPISRRRFLAVSSAALAAGAADLRGFAQDAAVATVNDDIRAASVDAELSMQFTGSTAAECRAWQADFRAKLNELLGDTTPPAEWSETEISVATFDDHIRYELLLSADGAPDLPIYLLMPRTVAAARAVPGVMCVHGHGNYGHHPIVGRTDIEGVAGAIESANYDYGLEFVRRGYAVAAPCMVPFGDRVEKTGYGNQDPCAVTFVRMQALGMLPMAENLRDLRWTLSYLQSRPEVLADRLGCAGLSYGGRMTMLVSAIDERIRVTAVSGALNLLQERITHRYSCGSQIIPGLLKYGDYSEIGSLIAPRPCVWEVGSDDGLVVPGWSDTFRERLRRAYGTLGVSENLQFDDFEGGHRWNGEVAFPLFQRVLKS
jgi:dienelactone hydrolase